MTPLPPKTRVLVLCTGNSCRSQMAEAWVRERLGTKWDVASAGTEPAAAVHPLAARAMAEVGIDLAGARPKPVSEMIGEPWDLVVTVCDAPQETCPVFPGAVAKLHLSFDDPARATGDEEQRLTVFRRVRDEIAERLLPALSGFAAAVEGR